jgi:hypothetical protein
MLVLHAAVGAEAPNGQQDVRAVQSALNALPPGAGGPAAALSVDGRCGPRTLAAIARFQLHHFGWTDFRIDPGQGTARRLSVTGPQHVVAGPAVPMAQRARAVRMALSGAAAEMVAAAVPVQHAIDGGGVLESFTGTVMVNDVPAQRGQRLRRGDRVGTLDNSTARFLLYFGTSVQGDKHEVTIGENSLVVLLGRGARQVDAGAAAPTGLDTGRLRGMLTRLAGGG